MRLLYTGGGTMGSVTPLLAVHEAIRDIDSAVEAVWVGTSHGPERGVVEGEGMEFIALPMARLRRFVSTEWLWLPLRLAAALYKAAQVVRAHRPDIVASAGGYTALPVILMAKIFGAKVWVHQQDVRVTLTTRLTAPLADVVTCAWKASLGTLPRGARVVGNPVRSSITRGSCERAARQFTITNGKPTVLMFGGGTGAAWLNETIDSIAGVLAAQSNIIHLTGIGKQSDRAQHPDHHVREFLDREMADALALADVVVCRAGMGTLTELAALRKPSIIIPLPHSAQEANAQAVAPAAIVLDQSSTTPADLLLAVVDLLNDSDRRVSLGKALDSKLRTDIAKDLAQMLVDVVGK